tara:strand:+ start:829 stop:1170 length:342 start_codon:yes stop_codon:yes gene_type:complete
MFNFGNPEDTAKLFLDEALRESGPEIPTVPYDELEEEELRNALAYLHIAIGNSLEDGADEDVVDILVSHYDNVFYLLAGISQDFREAVQSNRHFPATGSDPDSVKKYSKLADL